jgi:hypothetical protein
MERRTTKKSLVGAIVLFEALGFILVILMIWVDEVADTPSLVFGAPVTPTNWIEGVMETVFVLLLGGLVVYLSWHRVHRIKFLEGMLPVCSFCKRIRVDGEWQRIEQYIEEHSAAEFTHSLCPDCMEKHYHRSPRLNHVVRGSTT